MLRARATGLIRQICSNFYFYDALSTPRLDPRFPLLKKPRAQRSPRRVDPAAAIDAAHRTAPSLHALEPHTR